MAQFVGNATPNDPYENFEFRVKWDGKFVAGVSRVGGIAPSGPVASHRLGGDPQRKSPGQSDFEPITLERGVTWDLEFEQWANKVWDYANSNASGGEVSLKDFRKDIEIELYDTAGQKVMAYTVFRCWPSEYTSMPELDAMANGVAIQSLTLEHEGWQRDTSATER